MSAGQHTRFACACGQLAGHVQDASPKTTVRARCFCADCRAAEVYHGQPDPEDTGVDLVMVDPAKLSIETGLDKLGAIKIYPKGIMRWYATCCGARLFNTLDTPRFVFITLVTHRVSDPSVLGPEQARAFVPTANGKTKHENALRLYIPMIKRSLARLVTGGWRRNPLVEPATGKMRVTPHVLTREERRAIGLVPKTSAT